MKASVVALAVPLLLAVPAGAASIDMNDPYRAVGREFDVRVDAQLVSEVIRHGSPIAITYQIQNFSGSAVAVAEKVAAATYDPETLTITVSLGTEIPLDGEFPRMTTVAAGEKKVFTAAAMLGGSASAIRASGTQPRYLQIKVNVLRDLAPFTDLLTRQRAQTVVAPMPLSDDQFDHWFDANRTIFLNSLPVRFERTTSRFDASNRSHVGSR